MLNVNIEKILPVTEARDSLNKIVEEVNSSDEMYVLTVNGKPNAVVVGVQHLEKLTGTPQADIINQAAAGGQTSGASQTDDVTNTATTTTPAADTTTEVEVKPAESLPTDSTPDQPLVGKDAVDTESPLPPAAPGENAAPIDTAQTTQPGPQQDPEASAPLNGEPADASPVTTGQSVTPDTDPFTTPGPDDIFEQGQASAQGGVAQPSNNPPSNNPPAA